jgi:hypothetical protein
MEKLDLVSQNLFNKLKGRFGDVSTWPEGVEPGQARIFDFNYRGYGNVFINIGDGKQMLVIYGGDITRGLEKRLRDPKDKDDWYRFLESLRAFANRNLLTFKPSELNRRLTAKDLKQEVDTYRAQQTNSVNESVKFGPLKGRTRSSQQRLGPARIIIRHTTPVDETVRGSRTRRIDRIYIENSLGERRMMPVNSLPGARAMARHVAEGGSFDDDIGHSITEMVAEMSDLSRFVRAMKHRQFEDATTCDMVRASESRYHEVRTVLERMKSSRGYTKFKENFEPTEMLVDDVDTNELRDRFTKKVFPEALESVLPRVHRAYQRAQTQVSESMAPDRAREIARRAESRIYAESVVYADGRSLVSHILGRLAEAIADPKDHMCEFAAKWSEKLSMLEEQVDETLQEEYALAVQLARQYVKGLSEAQEQSSQGLESAPEDEQSPDEAGEFADWADQTAQDSQQDEQDMGSIDLGPGAEVAIAHLANIGIDNATLNDYLRDLSEYGVDEVEVQEVVDWLEENDPESLDGVDFGKLKVDEVVGGDPAEDFLDSVEDPDVEKYGADTMSEPVELYRRMGGLI